MQPRDPGEQPRQAVAPDEPPDAVTERRAERGRDDHGGERLTSSRGSCPDDDEADLARHDEIEQERGLGEGEAERDELEPRRPESADVVEEVADEVARELHSDERNGGGCPGLPPTVEPDG